MSSNDDHAPLSLVEQQAVDWLVRLRAGDRRDQQAFENWYSADASHADAYDRVLATWDTAGRVGGPMALAPARRRWSGISWGAVAALLVLAVGIGIVLNTTRSEPGKTFVAATRVGEIRTVALEDGTRVTLDTQSSIRAEFNPTERRVRVLAGRAHFDIAAEPRPFLVATDGGSVSTNSAVLDLSYIDGRTQVGLVSGTADFKPGMQKAAVMRIGPGRGVEAGRDGMIGDITNYTVEDGRWTSGMLSFEDAPLATVVATANRYNDSQIVLGDPTIGALPFTGTVKANSPIDLARMIAAMFKLHLDISDPRRLRLSR